MSPMDFAGEVFLKQRSKGATAGEAFEEALLAVRGRSLTPLEEVAKAMRARSDLLRSPLRERGIVRQRDEAAWRLRESGMTLVAIGRALGGRDHSTILSAIRRHETRMRA